MGIKRLIEGYSVQWFKHDTSANMDAKLQEVLLDYGLEGYGLYWYCIELIAGKIGKDNITFALEHDARIIARNTGSSAQKVEEMMRQFVSLGLFEHSGEKVTCLKLARRLDQSMTSNPSMRALIASIKNHDDIQKNHDAIMTESSERLTESCKNRLDKNRLDKNNKHLVESKPRRAKFKYSPDDLASAEYMFSTLTAKQPEMKKPNLESWAAEIRKMRQIDKLDPSQISDVWNWARNDNFWASNILSVKKFREKYQQLLAKMRQPKSTSYQTTNERNAARMAEIRDPQIAGNW